MNKLEITQSLEKVKNDILKDFEKMPATAFFKSKNDKWSAAENLEHLNMSVRPLNKLFFLPAIALRQFGKPNRPMRTYDEMKTKYYEKLGTERAAPSRFSPKVDAAATVESALNTFKKDHQKFIKRLNSFSEKQLDTYLIPHPLLGKLYVREMLYFTHFHMDHHFRIAKERSV